MEKTHMKRIVPILFLFLTLIISSAVVTDEPGLADPGDGVILLNEISPWPSDDVVWVELINPNERALPLDGYTVEFLSGFSYMFPEGSGEIDPGSVHLLRITGPNPLDQAGDGCILTGSDGPVDVVTWGSPPYISSETGLSPGVPLVRFTGVLADNEGPIQPDGVCIRVPGTWPPYFENWQGSHNWAYRGNDSASPGEPNPYPLPAIICPSDGARIGSEFELIVMDFKHEDRITFQVASDTGFQDVVIEDTIDGNSLQIDDIESGTYYWRVRAENSETWTGYAEFTRVGYDIEDILAPGSKSNFASDLSKGGQTGPQTSTHDETLSSRVIPCPHFMQNKDTNLVCLDGCEMNGNCAWCSGHSSLLAPGGSRYDCPHGRFNCGRAVLAMVAASGGCTLSQDRISYYMFEESGPGNMHTNKAGYLNDPRGDMKHMGTYTGETPHLLNWIYNYTGGFMSTNSAYAIIYSPDIFDDGDTSDMDSIKEYIDNGRPVIRNSKDHSTLITGYAVVREIDGVIVNWIQVQNPASNRPNLWFTLESTKDKYSRFIFPPKTGSPMRNDELEIDIDTDGDGLFDFDELYRFGTLPGDEDTDGDGVKDMQDVVGYVFERDGSWLPVDPDIDSDGARKESDPDNDRPMNDGITDGCEDANHDGFWTPGGRESSCFVDSDDFTVVNPECFAGFVRVDYKNSLIPDSWEKIVLDGGSFTSDEYLHSFSYYYWHELITSGIASVGNPAVQVDYQGTGLAKVILEKNSITEYTITIDVQPGEVNVPTTMSFGSATQTLTIPYPLTFVNWTLTPDILGPPQVQEDGSMVLKGYMDLFAGFDPNTGTYTNGYVTNQLSGLNPIAGSGGTASQIVSWEIWIQGPDDES